MPEGPKKVDIPTIGGTLTTTLLSSFLFMDLLARRSFSGMNEEPIHSLLTGYELAQLANLCCEEAEEAKALIPR